MEILKRNKIKILTVFLAFLVIPNFSNASKEEPIISIEQDINNGNIESRNIIKESEGRKIETNEIETKDINNTVEGNYIEKNFLKDNRTIILKIMLLIDVLLFIMLCYYIKKLTYQYNNPPFAYSSRRNNLSIAFLISTIATIIVYFI